MKTLFIVLFVSTIGLAQTTYYVDITAEPGGNGTTPNTSSSNGTHAWDSVEDVINFKAIKPGDVVLFHRGQRFTKQGDGRYNGAFLLMFNNDGVTYSAYGGTPGIENNPIIDGENKWQHVLGVWSTIRHDNITIKNLTFTRPYNGIDGCNAGNIVDCDFVTIDSCVFDADGAEMALYISKSNNYKITNSVFKNATGPHPLDYVKTSDWVEPLHGIYSNGCSNVLLENNKFLNNRTGGFKTNTNEGWNTRITLKNNWFEGCGTPIALFGCDKAEVFYNVIITNYDIKNLAGISDRGYFDAIIMGGGLGTLTQNSKIYNNTFITSDSTNNCVVVRTRVETGNNNELKNNLFYQAYKDTKYYNWQTYIEGPSLNYDYNLWYVVGNSVGRGWSINGSIYNSFSSWQSSAGQDIHGKWAKPLFSNFDWKEYPLVNKDLTPRENSPVIDAGVKVFDWDGNPLATDFNGNAIVGAPDLGAFEYKSVGVPPVASFNVDDRTPLTTQTVVFTDASTNAPTSWQWTFSPSTVSYVDGTSSTSKNPHVRFNSAGSYSVTLRVTNSSGSDTDVKNNYITATVPVLIPVASFSANNQTPLTTQTVVFTDASTNTPTSWQWTFNPSTVSYVDGTSSTSKNPHVRFNSVATYSCTLRVSNSAGSDLEVKTNFITVSPTLGVNLNISLFLAGPYENNGMKTTLNEKGFLPKVQPFNVAPWNYSGSETVPVGFSENIVDWVLIELRTDLAASTQVARKAALIKSSGEVADVLKSGLAFPNVPVGSYYIVVYHRNHLSVMSSTKVSLTDTPVLYDFTNSQAKAFGSNSMQNLGDGKYGLYSGDGNSDGIISNNDIQNIWIPQFLNSIDGYQTGDFNLDGSVTASDNNIFWLPNNGIKSNVPK